MDTTGLYTRSRKLALRRKENSNKTYYCRLSPAHRGCASVFQHEMFKAFNPGIYRGTLNMICLRDIVFPKHSISLLPYHDLWFNGGYRKLTGYSPRLYPATLAGIKVWVFRPGNENYLDNLISMMTTSGVAPNKWVEIISECGLMETLKIDYDGYYPLTFE